MCSEAKISWPLFERTWFHSLWWTRFIILLFCRSLFLFLFLYSKNSTRRRNSEEHGSRLKLSWWQCYQFRRLNNTLRTCSSQWLLGEKQQCFGNRCHTWTKPLKTSDPACSYISWCQAITGHITVFSLSAVYKYSPVSWFTNPLIPIRDVLISAYKWTKCWVLEPCPLTWRVKEVVVRSKGKSRGDVCH